LAFVLWCRHRRKNWRKLVSDNCAEIYGEALKTERVSLQELIDRTGFSQPTVSKYVKRLRNEGFLDTVKKRPLIVEAAVTDIEIFYANSFDLALEELEKSIPELDASSGVGKIEDEIAKIHIFSSTRTEGNTASRDDVERVLQDLKLHNITATETLDIMDLKRAIDLLRTFEHKDFTSERLIQLNAELLDGTEDDGGEFVGDNDISGTRYTPPQSIKTVRMALRALCNFLNTNIDDMKAEVLAGISHFIFVSINPFVDGNGRTGRLLHSWVLMKRSKPMFIYDPRLHNEYKEKLERGNFTDIKPFLKFCVGEHQNQLDRLEGESREPIFEVEEKTKKEVEESGSKSKSPLKDFS
jgi:Fic family protein